MKDLYLGDLIQGEMYETFDGNVIYISKLGEHYCEVYERPRTSSCDWKWNVRTVKSVKERIRTIMEVF